MGEDILNKIGTIKKPHGLKGAVKIYLDGPYESFFSQADAVFLKGRGTTLPYFIESVEIGNDIIIKFEDVDSKEDAESIRNWTILIPQPVMEALEELTAPAEKGFSFVQFQIIDATLGEVGVIEELIELPQHTLASVLTKDQTILIPLHEDLIQKVDRENKQLLMDLPEGLLEL